MNKDEAALKMTITRTFDAESDESEIMMHVMGKKAFYVLWDINEHIRQTIKYCDDEWLTQDAIRFLERILDEIHDSRLLEYID